MQSPRDRMGCQAWQGIRAFAQETPQVERQEAQGRDDQS